MASMGTVKVSRSKGEVIFTFTEIVSLCPVAKPCKLKSEIRFTVTEENKLKATVGGLLFTDRSETEGLIIKAERTLKVKDIEIEMVKGKHEKAPFKLFYR